VPGGADLVDCTVDDRSWSSVNWKIYERRKARVAHESFERDSHFANSRADRTEWHKIAHTEFISDTREKSSRRCNQLLMAALRSRNRLSWCFIKYALYSLYSPPLPFVSLARFQMFPRASLNYIPEITRNVYFAGPFVRCAFDLSCSDTRAISGK